ncbi:MAG: ABC transporter permease, partial [Microbacterium sp.]
GVPALTLVLERLPATGLMAGVAIVLAVAVAVPAGVIGGARRGSWADRVVMSGSLLGQSLPTFWIGLMLIMVFAVGLRWLPTGGFGGIQHLILPAVTLALWTGARTARVVRSGMIEQLSLDYVRTAKAKGVAPRTVVARHALRNVLLPVITVIGLDLAVLLGGAVVTEVVFAWPGVGRLVVDSIMLRDFPVVQAAVLVISVIYVLVNLGVDLLYSLIDPRTRLE